MEISSDLLPYFMWAGWYPERRVTLSDKVLDFIPKEHPAAQILSMFSGLHVGSVGPGEQCATSDVIFGFIECQEDEIGVWNGLLRTNLVGVAEYHHSHGELYMDAIGQCYSLHLGDTFCIEGEDFNRAMRNLLLGRRARPMLLPGQESVMVYGDITLADRPEASKYEL